MTEPPDAVLRERARGDVLDPSDPGYDDARGVWNAMVDSRPDLVLRCVGAADVVAGVETAREFDLTLGVKGGGHHVSGCAVPDEGLLLDLGPMDDVAVAPGAERVRVGPGATWGQVDHETAAFGRAVPGGQDPNIGVAGLTLGGGVGWLSRKYGLTSDNLLGADVVTADGQLVRASEGDNPDLFWALRGGGGNVGIVTAFEFRLHPVDRVFAGSLVYPTDDLRSVAKRYESFVADAPREVRVLFGSMTLPDSSYFPESVRDSRVSILICCYAGPADEGREVLAPLREFDTPLVDSLRERPYTAFQRAGDSGGPMRTTLRTQYLSTLSDDALAVVEQFVGKAPSPGATVFVSPRSGAETDPPSDPTAYPHREDCHHLLVEARWDSPDRDDEHVSWVRAFHEALTPYTTDGAAMNFLTDDEPSARVRAAYGDNYERLARVKARWDPENLFRSNQNVPPADR
ncbi:FAD-binding oxidoreductase [Halomarina rubra]|uniref:FAD-binding oxidoreductase n=1 Tax=Halomarina rubra TaxID=2071873 RepID=A0ABD6AXT8_9EURY|nr:FAD-binding oxidoreductase [Halomarina rubra]